MSLMATTDVLPPLVMAANISSVYEGCQHDNSEDEIPTFSAPLLQSVEILNNHKSFRKKQHNIFFISPKLKMIFRIFYL